MAAYAALVSLLNNLEQIQNYPRFSTSFDKHQIGSLGENIDFLLDFVESYNCDGGLSKEESEELESQIASAAHEAEDVIESHIVDQILPGSAEMVSDYTCLNLRCLSGLQKVIQYMDYIKKKILKVKEKMKFNYQKPTNLPSASPTPLTTPAASSSRLPTEKTVGFEDELMELKDVLTGQQSSRKIISIVGMGGMGKTTLARNVYEDSLIMQYFDLRAWVTISQECNVREILLQLLSLSNGNVDELGARLHKRLFGRRYLIVLDDMWSIEVWDNIKFFFPDNGNGSRVVVTTRLSNVATFLCSFCIRINFLDENRSWNLFCQKVFEEEDCPPQLVGIGKKIVEQCKGLPLSLVVIGGLLRNSCRTEEFWQNVAININSVLSSRENGQCLDVLYLSYSHLPAHLKPCFLYMGTYREDYVIRISQVIKLWVAEGFLRPNGVQTLEEIAEDYLNDLIERNLILVCKRRYNGKIKCCRIHDLLRELCLWVANKEKFFCLVRAHSIPQGIDRERRIIFHDTFSSKHKSDFFKALQSASLARSLISIADGAPVKCRLLRVLNKAFSWSTEAELQNVNLRYVACLSLKQRSELPSSTFLIWNLQTLVIRTTSHLQLEIWKMTQLRHLECNEILLPDPPPSDEKDDSVLLVNLQTLKRVSNFKLSEEVCKRIPNIKKLRITTYVNYLKGYNDGDCLYDSLQNLGRLHKLESLNIWCSQEIPISMNELKKAFPSSLNKLCLRRCRVDWKDLSMVIGSLPQLEVLKLAENSSEVCEWSCVKGGFLRLKFLQIKSCPLKSWTLDCASAFPVLEKLVLIKLWGLNEIPSGFGEVTTLQLIRFEKSRESAVISAIKIKEEQESFGNDGLQIQVMMYEKQADGFKRSLIKEVLSINNIQLLDNSEEELIDFSW